MTRYEPELPHEHDMPPRWDNFIVEWQGWTMPTPIFACPPPRVECCPRCGSTDEQPTTRGLVGLKLSVTLEQIEGYRRAQEVGRVAGMRLFAHRCPRCQLDTIYDLNLGAWWDLDFTDYGDAGSTGDSALRLV